MQGQYALPGGLLMRIKEALTFIFKVVLLGLAILMIIFGVYTDILNGEKQQMHFESDSGKSMPEEGYFTPVYDPMTYIKVEVKVEGGDRVEVHLYTDTYRGGKIIKDTDNMSVTRDEWLAAGKEDERIGSNVVLKDFTTVSAQYWIRVVDVDGSIPSEANYVIDVRARTYDLTMIAMGLLFYAIFIFMGILENVQAINTMLKQGVIGRRDEMPPVASDLEALLEPTAGAPPAAALPPTYEAPTSAPSSYETMYGAPAPVPAAPAYQPPPPQEPPAYQPPAPPAYQPPPPQEPPAYQPPAPPAYQPPPAPMAAPVAPAPAGATEAVSKVRCPACKSIVPVYTNERPTPIECPTCGKKGMIR